MKNVFTSVIAAIDASTAKTISNTANIAAFAIFDVSAAINVATPFSLLRNRYCFWCQVFTVVIAASDSTSAKTISDTASIAAFAIFDVSAAISVATAFSLLRNGYCLLGMFSPL